MERKKSFVPTVEMRVAPTLEEKMGIHQEQKSIASIRDTKTNTSINLEISSRGLLFSCGSGSFDYLNTVTGGASCVLQIGFEFSKQFVPGN